MRHILELVLDTIQGKIVTEPIADKKLLCLFAGSRSNGLYHLSGPIHQIPKHILAPYNAQATLHFYEAFWGLYLPITVPGRVSDIWRSYFTQALFPKLDLHLAFLPRPIVTQDRNPHSITGDFAAEQDLYLKTSALVNVIFNIQKTNNFTSVPTALEEVFIAMFERGLPQPGIKPGTF